MTTTGKARASNDDVLAVGLNPKFRSEELPSLKRAVARSGGMVIAVAQAPDTFGGTEWRIVEPGASIPRDAEVQVVVTDQDGIKLTVYRTKEIQATIDEVVGGRERHFDLTIDAEVRAFLTTLGLPAEKTNQLAELIIGAEQAIRDELCGIARVLARGERGEPVPSRVLISGHSSNAGLFISGEENGTLAWDTLQRLAELLPEGARQVEDLHVSGCNSGGEPMMATYRAIFPELKTIWSYVETCPGAGSGSDVHQAIWAKATAGDVETLDWRVATGTRFGVHVAAWQRSGGPNGTYSDGIDEVPLERLSTHYREAYAGMYPWYFDGRTADPSTQSGALRAMYNQLGALLRHPELTQADRAIYTDQSNQMIRLIFYKQNIAPKFAQEYLPYLKGGYAAIGQANVPDFANLSRADALAEIERLRVAGRSKDLSPDAARQLEGALERLTKGLRDLDPRYIPASWL